MKLPAIETSAPERTVADKSPVVPPALLPGASSASGIVELLSLRPPIAYLRDLLTIAESRYLVRRARAATRPGERTAVLSEAGRYSDDVIASGLQRRLVAWTGRPIECFEPMTTVLCRRGQRLRPHWDAEEYPRHLRQPQQSVISVFLHLTTLTAADGGALVFPRIGLEIQPVAGDAACWLNVTPAGRVLRKTLHFGAEVTGDIEKWAINVWIGERPA